MITIFADYPPEARGKLRISVKKEEDAKEESVREEIQRRIADLYKTIENWMRPDKSHPVVVQILLFILKLPILFILLLLSPILLVVLLALFLLAL